MVKLYEPQIEIDWTSSDAFPQSKLWRKEVEQNNGRTTRLITRECQGQPHLVHMWNSWLKLQSTRILHSISRYHRNSSINWLHVWPMTSLSKKLGMLSAARHKPGENTMAFNSQIIKVYERLDFPEGINFFIAEKLIHGSNDTNCRH